tara:strand:+ start:1203 stop:1427 length:225 start_codon:yes stop_codon:yes gene_type:complete
MNKYIMIIALVLFTTSATANETIDKKVTNFVANEWVEIKEYQTTQWQSGNEQVKNTWTKLKNFMWKVGNNVTQD